jgi:hypothetical protein
MAVSIQVSSVSSRVQGIPQISAAGAGSENLLRSQFLGSGRICIPSGARKNGVVSHNVVRAGTVRSASIFETLGKFFSSSYEDEEQVLQVYEINDLTGYSPAKLDLAPSKGTFPTLGDFVPYTNKVCFAKLQHSLALPCTEFIGIHSQRIICLCTLDKCSPNPRKYRVQK